MKKLKALFLVMAALAVTTMFTSCEAFAKAFADTMTGPMKVQVMNRCDSSKLNEQVAFKVTIYEVNSSYANIATKSESDNLVLSYYSGAANNSNTKDISVNLEAGHTYKVVVENKTASALFNSYTCDFIADYSASKAYVNNEHPDCFIPTGYNTYNIKLYDARNSSLKFVIEKTAIPR